MYLMLALFTFDPADPGWSQTGYQTPVRNLGGSVGAYLSDLLLNLFGVIAYTLPFVIAIVGWLLFQRFYRLMQLDYLTLGLKLVGFFMFYIGVTSLASMNFDDIFYFSAGGILGDVLSGAFLPYFSFVGSTLVFLLLTCTGFVFLTGISWLEVIDNIGRYAIAAALFIAGLPKLIGEKFSSEPKEQPLVTHKRSTEDNADVDANDPLFSETPKEDKAFDETPEPVKHAFEQSQFDAADELAIAESNRRDDNHFDEPPFAIDNDSFDSNNVEPHIGDIGNDRVEPFIEIDELITGPLTVNVQENVSESEIAAAFEPVEKIQVAEPQTLHDKINDQLTEQARAEAEAAPDFVSLPSLDLLDRSDKQKHPIDQEQLTQVSRLVEAKLSEFGIKADVVDVFPGPVITRFELDLAPGVKVSKITNLSKDIARSLSAKSVRVVEVIEGKSVIGIELPNKHRETVYFSDVLSCDTFEQSSSNLAMAIGSDISGEPVVADLAKMPHLLVAGTTGSGKSVAVNTMIVSILYKSSPEDVRMIMIDPKQVELSVYDGIPHLLSEVVTDMKEAANALRWCVGEMERRYQLMSKLGVRNLKGYNDKVAKAIAEGEPLIDPLWQPTDAFSNTPPTLEKLPSIVIVVDEFADMMMIVGKKVEELIARIAQKARAAGIHLILATQRPSADVITGLIKANIPTRMALRVQSRIESRIILDQQGAEQLLGMGDMFYLPPGEAVPVRVHGAFVNDDEVHAVVSDWKSRGEPNYLDEIKSGDTEQEILLPGEQAEAMEEAELDPLYDEALAFVSETRRVSISSVQRKFRIGYNRAARIVEDMEMQGAVSSPGHNGAREVLAPPPVKD
ncbi:DNA translocase FtsK [Thalassotalea euphylliae]|uniref:DNA translocase FtsK n=1 Tax=Thalassotalea euphylliae TaxID=1655234 RepID=A0A3E0TWY7_9GAMM|nr:DNA translocase FtsK [Thalassotalea euphylliae]